MRAARLHGGERRLRLEEVPTPQPSGDEVLVRVTGAGVCHSDLHVLDGMFDDLLRLPVTMGHEIAGRVEGHGPDARGLEIGEPVVVMVGWGCGHCEWCVAGHEQLCREGDEAGATRDGGFAELVLVPHRRHVVPLGALDPLEATPFGCAALCAYAAIKRVRPHLSGGSTVVVIGAGGLGQYGIQFARVLTGATIVSVDVRQERLDRALELGADHAVVSGPDSGETILELTHGRGADAVVDFVGTNDSLALAGASCRPTRARCAPGPRRRVGLFRILQPRPRGIPDNRRRRHTARPPGGGEARAGRSVLGRISTYPLGAVNDALDDLRAGQIDGRAVLVP